MCQVSPDHVSMLNGFAMLCITGAAVSVLTGHTYFRRVIARDAEPLGFWSNTIGLALLGSLCLAGLTFCPRG
jgi:hypothetical protein